MGTEFGPIEGKFTASWNGITISDLQGYANAAEIFRRLLIGNLSEWDLDDLGVTDIDQKLNLLVAIQRKSPLPLRKSALEIMYI